ncbi:uncharacterized protein LOC105661907 [Megachile rotundata]|uniref:uncharacterized protein LOC105661907 n=1 Tax=Megachile rotundata TaxID=143995 RepID=UPI003FCF8E69
MVVKSVSAMSQTKIQYQNISNKAKHFIVSLEKRVKEEIDNEEKLEDNFNPCTKNMNRKEHQSNNKNINEDENRGKEEIKREQLNKSESDCILGKYELVTVKMEEQFDNEQEVSKSIMSPKLETVPVSTTKITSPQFIKKHSAPKINGMSEIRIRSLKMLQNLIQTPKSLQKQICDNSVCISPGATNMITIKEKNEFNPSDNGIKSYPRHKDMLFKQRNITKNESFKHVFGSCTKRRKTSGSTMHKKHMSHPGAAARNAPLLLRTSIVNCSFINID